MARTLAAVAVSAALAQAAVAAQHPYVTVYGGPSDPVVLRLVPELLSLGCAVRTDASPMPDPSTFKEGDAVVRVTETTVTFWMLDARSGRATEEGTVRIDDRGAEGIKLTSVRVSGIVRAELLRFDATESPAGANRREALAIDAGATDAAPYLSGDGAAPADPVARAKEEAPPIALPPGVTGTPTPEAAPSVRVASSTASAPAHASVSLGPLVLVPAGGAKAGLDLGLAPAWHVSSNLQLRLLLAVPLTSPSVTGTGGEAAIATWAGGVTVNRVFRSTDDAWRATLGAGAAAVLSRAHGTATSGYAASDTSAVMALPFVEVGGWRALGTPRVRLGVSALLGVALPPVVVQFAGQSVATWGPVVGGGSASLDVDIW